jgi:small subunit ribosomal protein S8
MNDPISDMLARIRNAQSALLPTVELPHSRIKSSIAEILKKEGYIHDVQRRGQAHQDDQDQAEIQRQEINHRRIAPRQHARLAALRRRVRKSREFAAASGISILSTSQGVMSGQEARKKNVGGELLCYVW